MANSDDEDHVHDLDDVAANETVPGPSGHHSKKRAKHAGGIGKFSWVWVWLQFSKVASNVNITPIMP